MKNQELDKISKEIQEIIKNYEEPDLTFSMSNTETKTVLLPFEKKAESDLPRIKLTSFNTSTNKNEDFLVYDYVEHLKKIGFTWEMKKLGIKYTITINNSEQTKLKKQRTIASRTRSLSFIDESRV